MANRKSYSKFKAFAAGISAVSITIFILTSCDGTSGRPPYEDNADPAGTYRGYLSEIRKRDNLSFGELTGHIRRWQSLKDTVFSRILRDTVPQSRSDTRQECLSLHDSIRAEFSRLALSRPRTYKELLMLKEQFSPYAKDEELHRSAEAIRPFFVALDKRPAYRDTRIRILPAYRAFLAATLDGGIHSRADLTAFIEEEDALFRTFITRWHALGETNVSDITRDTEKCCAQIFLAAARKEITYKEAIIYTAMRTDRRVIQSVRTCLDDIRRGEITTPAQAHACIWMMLQPYASLDGCCMTLLSDGDRQTLYGIAEKTPEAFRTLKKILSTETGRLDELPGMLMEIFITTTL